MAEHNCLLLRKFSSYAPVSKDGEARLRHLGSGHLRHFSAHENIIHEGAVPSVVQVIQSGWAFRYRQFEDGQRQTVGLLLPGDMFDAHIFNLARIDHSIAAVTPVTTVAIDEAEFMALAATSPEICRFFIVDLLADARLQREWIVNLGSRNARQRVAHFLMEIFTRLRRVGLAREDSCDLPLTQRELGKAVALSTVQVNRVVQDLRANRVIEVRHKVLTLANANALIEIGEFNNHHLHDDGGAQR